MTTARDRATRDRLAEALATAQARPHAAIPVPDGLYPSEIAAIADALLPVVAELVREGQAEALAPFEELFSGGPDTSCRTTWQESALAPECSAASIECVEVPMADLRETFDRAHAALRAPRTEGAEP